MRDVPRLLSERLRSKVRHVLLVEDNPGDILLVKESFRDSRIAYVLSIANDGQEAIDFLDGIARNKNGPRPDLMLLDLNLPKINGYDVLAHVKGTEELRSIPVLVLSTSSAQSDIQRAYALSANCYLCKPAGLDEFFHLMRALQEFWLKSVEFPERGAAANA